MSISSYQSVYIVIPVHNRKELTHNCLASLMKQDFERYKIIVVDDGSTDGTAEMIFRDFPEVIVLTGDGNLWWTGAVNKGITKALAMSHPDDYILVLNDDLVVPSNYISVLTELASTRPNTLIGSVAVDIADQETIISGGVTINWITAKQHDVGAGQKLSLYPYDHFVNVSILTGRGVLIPSSVFQEIGLYDDRHFKQCGDTELPRRAQKAGYNLEVHYRAIVFSHQGSPNHINQREQYHFSELKKYFSDVRSNFNVNYRFWFAYNTRTNFLQAACYFVNDLARVAVHFITRLKLTIN